MDITSVRIFLNKGTSNPNVKGVAHVVINNAIVLRRIHLIANEANPDNIRVVYPVYHLQPKAKTPEEAKTEKTHRRCFYASTEESLAKLNEAILDAYHKVLADPTNDTVVLMALDTPETPFEITDWSIYPHQEVPSLFPGADTTLAKVNVELDGSLWLRGMYLMKKEDGTIYLRMPRRTHADGKRVDLYHPRTQVARDMLTEAVMPLYEAAVAKAEATGLEANIPV